MGESIRAAADPGSWFRKLPLPWGNCLDKCLGVGGREIETKLVLKDPQLGYNIFKWYKIVNFNISYFNILKS